MVFADDKLFPRGGNETSTHTNLRRNSTFQLFSRKPATTIKRKRGGKKKKKRGNTFVPDEERVKNLSYKALVEGMVILGRVRRVDPTCLSVSLPGHICGRLSLDDVSKPYSKALQELARNTASAEEVCYPLERMFQAGQPLVVRVEALGPAGNDVRLTADPGRVQGHWTRGMLQAGVVLVAAVRSVEEHVYVMDVGLSAARAFLKRQSVRGHERAWAASQPLGVGQVLRCIIVKAEVESTSVTIELSADPRLVNATVPTDSLALDSLIPGTRCEVAVTKVLREGLEVRVTDGVTGHVHRDHLLDPAAGLDGYDEGQEYPATLLYVVPTVGMPYLSLLPGACPSRPAELPLELLPVGTTVDGCAVISADGRGIVLRLGDKARGLRGYVSRQRALGADDTDPARTWARELGSKFAVGTLHRCRVLDYDYMDQVYICSTESNVLEAQFIHPSSVAAGQHVWCEVASLGPTFVTVSVLGEEDSDYRAFTAIVPVHHLSDDPLGQPEDTYRVGSRWKARVLSVEDLNVKLTLKPSLVSSELPVLASYEDAQPGECYDGTVIRILENGLLIKFYGDVAGFIPRSRITRDDDTELGKMFHVGQMVRCYVLYVKLEQEGLFLTLEPPSSETEVQDLSQPPCEEEEEEYEGDEEYDEEFEEEVEDAPGIEAEESCNLLRVGQPYRMRVTEVKEDRLLVSGKFEDGSAWSGEIPAQHLTDCSSLADSLLGMFSAGKRLNAFCWSAKEPIIFTKRSSAIAFFKDARNAGVIRRGLTAAKAGQLLPCSVVSVDSAGKMLLQVPVADASEPLRAPLQDLGAVKNSMIQPHKGLIGCVKLSHRKKRQLSVKLSDVCTNVSESALEVLISYLHNLDFILRRRKTGGSALTGFAPGEEVSGTVKKVSDAEVVLKLKRSGATCSVPPSHQPKESLKTGSKVKATVLFTDPVTGKVDVTMNPFFTKRIASKQGGKLPDSAQVGSELAARVVLAREEFVLVLLPGARGRGRLAYVPSRRHMNQLSPDASLCCVGDRRRVVVRRVINNKLVGVFKELCKENGSEASTKCRKRQNLEADEQSDTHKAEKLMNGSKGSSDLGINKAIKAKPGKDGDEQLTPEIPYRSPRESKSIICPNKQLSLGTKHVNGFSVNEENEEELLHAIEDGVETKYKLKMENVSFQDHNESGEFGEAETVSENGKANSVKLSSSLNKGDKSVKSERSASKRKRKRKSSVKEDQSDSKGSGVGVVRCEQSPGEEPSALEVGFVWNPTPGQLPAVSGQKAAESDSSSDDEAERQVTKKKRLSAAEKKQLARQEEARIRDIEMKLMSDSANPQTADDFDRLVLASPNNSALWIQYMAFHLQATEIEKARAVAEKALKTISFREEAEKLNVWVALLNLENLYGTTESLNSVLKDAVQFNDAETVYLKMLQIYCTSNKAQEAEQLVSLVCKRYKHRQEAWVQAGTALMRLGLFDKARSLLQRALASLDKKLHVPTICKFAQLEQQLGSAERAQTLFEQVLASYPQRVDVWTSYVDMLVKSGSVDIARQVLERAVAQRLPPHRMRTLFRKHLDFEQRHGSPEAVARVRQMAVSYVRAVTDNLQDD
ncbi:protein RRP5 homolog isoform X2 [Bacillus rossius redtenbacheri]|uniref:protein RRP5 homolog isoform X2 n=1 Tax=Bacillus rossius redtenbacheri TaxID=93214 RepID=UPI002FDEDDD7